MQEMYGQRILFVFLAVVFLLVKIKRVGCTAQYADGPNNIFVCKN